MGDAGAALYSEGVLIRKAAAADIARIVLYNQAMAKETEGIDLPDDVTTAGVQGVVTGQAQANAVYYLVEVQGQVVGQLMITFEWSDWRAAYIWWIQSVYVTPSHRGQGLFRRLYQYVRDDAIRQGACGLRLYADNQNTSAHSAYERLGMSSHYKVYEDMFTSY